LGHRKNDQFLSLKRSEKKGAQKHNRLKLRLHQCTTEHHEQKEKVFDLKELGTIRGADFGGGGGNRTHVRKRVMMRGDYVRHRVYCVLHTSHFCERSKTRLILSVSRPLRMAFF